MRLPPELIGAPLELGAVDFEVGAPVFAGPLPGGLGDVVADRTRAIVRVPGVGTFGVEEGARVRVDLEPGADRDRAFLERLEQAELLEVR
jgi:hypothetical protein